MTEPRDPQSDSLATWLRAQLDDIAGDANHTTWDGSRNKLHWEEVASATVDVGGDTLHLNDRTIKCHIMNHDPANVLADITAKRAILDELDRMERDEIGWDGIEDRMRRMLAVGYAYRPGYKDAWRP